MFIQLKLLKQNKQDQVFGEHTHINSIQRFRRYEHRCDDY